MSVEFKLTRDPQLLQQYYDLREQCFREELGLDDFDGSEDDSDRAGKILVAVQDGRCIGGVRISPTLTLPSQAQQLKLDKSACCMWERFVFDPTVRTVQLIREFFVHLIAASVENGFYHAMVLSSLRNARFYRICGAALGHRFDIHRHVPHCAQGTFAGLEHYLSVGHLLQEAQPLMATPGARPLSTPKPLALMG